MEREGQLQTFLDDGDEHVNGDSDPDLCLDGVLGGAEEHIDPQVRKTSRLWVFGSRYLIRRRGTGKSLWE